MQKYKNNEEISNSSAAPAHIHQQAKLSEYTTKAFEQIAGLTRLLPDLSDIINETKSPTDISCRKYSFGKFDLCMVVIIIPGFISVFISPYTMILGVYYVVSIILNTIMHLNETANMELKCDSHNERTWPKDQFTRPVKNFCLPDKFE